jgi:hypothetical protein
MEFVKRRGEPRAKRLGCWSHAFLQIRKRPQRISPGRRALFWADVMMTMDKAG